MRLLHLLEALKINPNRVAVAHDAFMAGASFLLALYLRLGQDLFFYARQVVIPGTLLFMAVAVGIFIFMRLYRGLWRYASIEDLLAITKAVTIAIIVFYPLLFLFNRLGGVPRAVPLIHWLLLLAMLGGPRFFYRVFKDRRFLPSSETPPRQIPVLLVGAGDHAETFLRHLVGNKRALYQVVGILDHDPFRIGRAMHGIRIYGGFDRFPAVVRKLRRKGIPPERLLLSEDVFRSKWASKILEHASEIGLPLARLPRLTEFQPEVESSFRPQPIAIEDLLGRPQNALRSGRMEGLLRGKRVLVTGAGGSIGGELARQIAACHPAMLILLDHNEFALYRIDKEIATLTGEHRAVLADVRDANAMKILFEESRPEIIFHAAAIKHVPIAEQNPEETVLTNIGGTKIIADAASSIGAEAMVLISTDKAVHPSSLMGATKRGAEYYCRAQREGNTRCFTVRFGNVLGSAGSVVPLFQEQIAKGGPLTITHPEMERYFMTVREAVELVILAAALGMELESAHAPVFVLDMGQPVKIRDIAEQMIRLSGLRPGIDIAMEITGLRQGEKLQEELFYAFENPQPTAQEGVLLASVQPGAREEFAKSLDALLSAATLRDRSKTLSLLKQIVPEYQ